jgi:hypothetical protein
VIGFLRSIKLQVLCPIKARAVICWQITPLAFFSSHLDESKSGNNLSLEPHGLSRCRKAVHVNKIIEFGKRTECKHNHQTSRQMSHTIYQYQLIDIPRSFHLKLQNIKTTGFMSLNSEYDLLPNQSHLTYLL